MATLNPQQAAALDNIAVLSVQYKNERHIIRRKIAEAVERELDARRQALAMAVRRAYELGVPLQRIGLDGLSTKDPSTPRKWLEETEQLQNILDELTNPFVATEDGAVRVRIPNFPTTATRPEAYPEVLEGVARRDAQGKWIVVEDPEVIETPTGNLDGWFTWEIQHGTLPAMLDDWLTRAA